MLITPCQREHHVPGATLTLLGAHDTVTGAMTRVDTGGTSFLIDVGVAQGKERRSSPLDGRHLPDGALDVDAVVLTHGHNDHCGSLPALLDAGFSGPIYGTAATLEIADIVLTDGLRLNGASRQEISTFRRRFRELSIAQPYEHYFAIKGARLRLREAGHILGSSSVDVLTSDTRVLLSGDLGRPSTPLLKDPCMKWPRPGGRFFDLVLMETTYGDGEHKHTHGDVERELFRIVQRALADGGHILVPAFAIGRTQTLLYHLNTLVERGLLPALPVAVDTPMGLRVTSTYDQFSRLFDKEAMAKIASGDDPLDFDTLYAVKKGRDSVRLRDVTEPMLIIAGSGMCTGGRIVGHLQELLPRPETCLLFIGYQAHGTPGRAIQRTPRGGRVRLDGEDVVVRAAVETLSGLSAHADRRELRDWLDAVPTTPETRVALHHGEPSAQRAFAAWLEQWGLGSVAA